VSDRLLYVVCEWKYLYISMMLPLQRLCARVGISSNCSLCWYESVISLQIRLVALRCNLSISSISLMVLGDQAELPYSIIGHIQFCIEWDPMHGLGGS
jgi:hypothetical protein